MVHAGNKGSQAAKAAGKDLGNRGRGFLAEAKGKLRREAVSERRLAARIRSKLGHVTRHPSAIEVEVVADRAILSGPILTADADAALSAARSVRGIAEVEDRLERHETAEGVPALQGEPDLPPRSRHLLIRPWPPAGRLAAGTTGSALALAGAKRRGPLGITLAALGAGLLARSLAADPVRRSGRQAPPRDGAEEAARSPLTPEERAPAAIRQAPRTRRPELSANAKPS
jgi:hypothetical protein